MASGFVIRKSQYYDSVFLMRIAKTLNDEPGVTQSAVVMATDANKELLAEIGITGPGITESTANDLVVALIANDAALVERLLATIDERLQVGFQRKEKHPFPFGGRSSHCQPGQQSGGDFGPRRLCRA